jgi:hypothetical protein
MPIKPGLAQEWRKTVLRLRTVIPVISAVAVAAVLTVTGTSFAAAGGGPHAANAPTRAKVHPAVSSRSLCQALWAVVNADGTLARAGCPGTTSATDGTGFSVSFPRNVRNCAYVATTGLTDSELTQPASFATTVGLATSEDGVFVATYNAAGATADEPFHLSVSCTPTDRAGQVKISWPNKSKSFTVTGGVSSATIVVATPRNNTGVYVLAVVPHSSSGTATIYLSRTPSKGHPVTIGWLAAH